MTKKTWLIFGIVCAALIAGLVLISRQNRIDVSNVDVTQTQTASSSNGNTGDHIYGNKDSKVVLIEYGDYQCPGCGSAYPIIKQITEKYKDKIGFIFRNFPLTTIHPNALAAASVAEAANKQGKFWEMHDALYENQNSWNQLSGADRTNYFVGLATNLGLNADTLRNDINDAGVQQKISFDQALGSKVGVTGTPSFYIGSKSVGDIYFLKDKIVPKGTAGAELAWGNAAAFESLVIIPALKENNIELLK